MAVHLSAIIDEVSTVPMRPACGPPVIPSAVTPIGARPYRLRGESQRVIVTFRKLTTVNGATRTLFVARGEIMPMGRYDFRDGGRDHVIGMA
jgi:hypothetical protein